MPTPDSGYDFVSVCGLGEGFRIIVGLRDETVYDGLEFDNAPEDTALQSLLGKFGEETLNGVGPRARDWREVKGEARIPVEPLRYLRMLMSGVVVKNHVHELYGRHLDHDRIQEADELLGHSAGPAFLHWQARLSAVEGMDLRILVDRENDGMGGRVDIEPDNIAQLVDELRVGGELKLRTRCS